jgi:hypothetical protein
MDAVCAPRWPGRRRRGERWGWSEGQHRRVPGGSARSRRGPARQLAVVVGFVLDSGACDCSACSSCWLVLERCGGKEVLACELCMSCLCCFACVLGCCSNERAEIKEKTVCYSVCMYMTTKLGCKLVTALEVISMWFMRNNKD